MAHDFSIPLKDNHNLPEARRWLLLGVAALGLAGLFSLLIVLARTPAFAKIPAFKDFFHTALVVHVDLSVLVWFLAIAWALWSLLGRSPGIPYLYKASFGCAVVGTGLLSLSAFAPSPLPVMSNYIPVLIQPFFFIGLSLLLCALLLTLVRLFLAQGALPETVRSGEGAQRFGIFTSAAITLMAAICFLWSGALMPTDLSGQEYYEVLFWGGGHVLQFAWVQLVVIAWLWMASALGLPVPLSARLLAALYGLNFLLVLIAPAAYLLYAVDSPEFRLFFTRFMILGNGVLPAVVALPLLAGLVKGKKLAYQRALWSSLAMSLLLFIYGGILGGMISGQNVTIPAHYHGAIVGVTLAFMGLTYLLLPQLGFAPVAQTRLAYWQPFVYGFGQIIHITALAYSGGYGVLRKTPGALEGGMTGAKIAMGIMGMGGLIAIIGGLMFVVAVIRSVRARLPKEKPGQGRA